MTKNKHLVVLIATISIALLLSSCTLFLAGARNILQEASPQEEETQEAPLKEKPSREDEDLDEEIIDEDGGIEMVSFNEDVDFETKEYIDGRFSYEIPADWIDFEEMAQPMVKFFCEEGADLDTHPSNVVVEIVEVTTYGSNRFPYAEKEIYETFFDFIIGAVHSTKPDLTVLSLAVWEASERCVYIVDTDRIADDGLVVRQTNYYPTGFDGVITVTATDFHDDLALDINEIARHIALTINID